MHHPIPILLADAMLPLIVGIGTALILGAIVILVLLAYGSSGSRRTCRRPT